MTETFKKNRKTNKNYKFKNALMDAKKVYKKSMNSVGTAMVGKVAKSLSKTLRKRGGAENCDGLEGIAKTECEARNAENANINAENKVINENADLNAANNDIIENTNNNAANNSSEMSSPPGILKRQFRIGYKEDEVKEDKVVNGGLRRRRGAKKTAKKH